jgi:hypothetical protein
MSAASGLFSSHKRRVSSDKRGAVRKWLKVSRQQYGLDPEWLRWVSHRPNGLGTQGEAAGRADFDGLTEPTSPALPDLSPTVDRV